MNADQACEAAESALAEIHPEWESARCPLSDGGEGFGAILGDCLGASRLDVFARDPLGRQIRADLALITWSALPAAARRRIEAAGGRFAGDDPLAILEMATVSGLALLSSGERNPWLTSSVGTGDLLRAAVENGARGVILGIGGSATNDLGIGALQALGLVFSGERKPTLPCPQCWGHIEALDASRLLQVPQLFIACDVINPLLGDQGATSVFGPQKGLGAGEVSSMETEMERLARMLLTCFGTSESLLLQPGSGAAGGIAFGLQCALGARMLPGAEFVAECLDLQAHLNEADLVLTGEGCFDQGSMGGKGPGLVIELSRRAGKRVLVFAGRVETALPISDKVCLKEISPRTLPLDACLRMGPRLLREAIGEALP
jgi:glycerate kinase